VLEASRERCKRLAKWWLRVLASNGVERVIIRV
jgi:hypothetical protein